MDRITELLASLQSITPEELEELQGLIDAEFDRLAGEPESVETVSALGQVVDGAELAAAEVTRRAEVAAQTSAAAEELRSRMKLLKTPAEEAEAETPTNDGAPEGVPTGEKTPEVNAEQVSIAASGRVLKMAAAMSKPTQRPGVTPSGRAVITASNLPNVPRNEVIESREQLAEGMCELLQRMDRHASGGSRTVVASARWKDQYPESRRLSERNSAEANMRILESVVSQGAVTASGGVCLPVNVDYSVPTWATADRPLRDGLASFQADRGGIRYVSPPDISALAGATAVWTEATDASPGSATKPVLTVVCGTEQLVYVDAVPTRLQFGNMQGRFAPEQIAANTDLSVAAAARIAELNLLAKIDAASTKVTTAAYLGATRDLLAAMDLAAAGYRYRHRIPRATGLTVILPDWAHDFLRADIARELAHDTNGRDPLALTDSDVDGFLSARGFSPIYMLDGSPLNAFGGNSLFQGFGTQGAAAINGWPVTLIWRMFVEGTFQFLDGGRLDLGVVRDATLDATNDYELFVEPFEGIAYRGIESITFTSTLLANGASAGTIAPSNLAE